MSPGFRWDGPSILVERSGADGNECASRTGDKPVIRKLRPGYNDRRNMDAALLCVSMPRWACYPADKNHHPTG